MHQLAKSLKMGDVARNITLNSYLFLKKNMIIVLLLFVFLLLDRFKRMKLLKIIRNLPIVCVVIKNFRYSFIILLGSLLSLNFGVFLFRIGMQAYQKQSSLRLRRPKLEVNVKLVTCIETSMFEQVLEAFLIVEHRNKWESLFTEIRTDPSSAGVFRVKL